MTLEREFRSRLVQCFDPRPVWGAGGLTIGAGTYLVKDGGEIAADRLRAILSAASAPMPAMT